ncbi:hypothetical protein ACWF82_10680 [Nocardia sp. NPDC055053]
MVAPAGDPIPLQRGLLDLSVDLSVPEVYSGSDFTVYLHIKNPFETSVWISAVELSLPTQLAWRSTETAGRREDPSGTQWEKEVLRGLRDREGTIKKLRNQLRKLPNDEDNDPLRRRIEGEVRELSAEIDSAHRLLRQGQTANVDADDGANIRYFGPLEHLNVTASRNSTVSIHSQPDESERVPLVGSLPRGTALEPGCTDVWTIRLGTGRNPLFLPAKYHLQLTVIYQTQPLLPNDDHAVVSPQTPRTYSNTTSLTVAVKAALWKVMLGGGLGGSLGSAARTLQDNQAGGSVVSGQTASALLLAVLLSGVAIVFAARKADAQSFVTVEDFWGGLLVGFLIGYSGTAAFSGITGIEKPAG